LRWERYMSRKEAKSRPVTVNKTRAGTRKEASKSAAVSWFDWRPGFMAVFAILAVSVLVCYGSSLGFGFVHDDRFEILQNPLIQDLSNIPRFFAMTAWGFQESSDGTRSTSNYYRPMQYTSYAILYGLFGFAPAMFHLFKVLLHLGNAILVYWLFRRLEQSSSVALVLALLFAVNPANSEAVCWISAVTDVSCAFFFLLTLVLYLKFRETGTWLETFLLGACFLIGLLFKETMVAAVPVLLVYEFLMAQRPIPLMRKVRFLSIFVVALAVYFGLRFQAMGGLVTAAQLRFDYLTPMQSIMNQVILVAAYLKLFFFPYSLNAFHVFHPVSAFMQAGFYLSLLALGLLAFLGFWWGRRLPREKRNLLVFGCVWFLVSIAPVIVFFKRIGSNVFAERYVYLPSVGLCMVSGLILWWIWDHSRATFAWLIPLLLLGAAGRTILRAEVWHDEQTFLETTSRQSPDSDVINANLGILYAKKQQYSLAEVSLRRGIASSSVMTPSIYVNLGNVLTSQSRLAEAAEAYEKVMQLRTPRDLDYVRLGQTYYGLKRYDQAIAILLKGYEVYPRQPNICYFLGSSLLNLKRFAEAKIYLVAAQNLGFADGARLAKDLFLTESALAKDPSSPPGKISR
jgi:protein O-mannosyl-transferase